MYINVQKRTVSGKKYFLILQYDAPTLMPWGGRQAGERGVRQSISVHVCGTSMII